MADLNFLNVDTGCTGIEISTPTAGKEYLEYIGGVTAKDFSSIKSYKIKYSTNCCTETEIVLPVWYNIDLNLNAGSCTVDGGNITFNLELTGINVTLIDDATVQFSLDNVTYTSTTISGTSPILVEVTVPIATTTYTIYVKFKNLDGFEYIVSDEYGVNVVDPCGTLNEVDNLNITYPSLPTNVVIDPITGYLDFNTLIDSDPAIAGVYQVIICEETLTTESCVQNHHFLECDIKCDVINKLVQCKDSDVLFFYDALRYSNDCTLNITYAEVCSIYELLVYKITTSGCYNPWDDCNCSGTTNIFSQNNNSTTTIRNCGCNG